MKNRLVIPFVKWVGGKRQLLNEIKKLAPKKFNVYFEPFLGGGAVLFELQPKKAIVNDINSELINTYKVIKNSPEELMHSLSLHENTVEYFYKTRVKDRGDKFKELSDIERASRLIYLNKTCYNGLYRVNSSGQFNTPFGYYKNPNIVNAPVIKAVHEFFKNNEIEFMTDDFDVILSKCKKGDFVYLDPPYDTSNLPPNFTGYNESGFNRDSQIRLKECCDKLHSKGVKFLLSNSATEFIIDLYKNYKIHKVPATRMINCDPEKRGEVEEVLILSYEQE